MSDSEKAIRRGLLPEVLFGPDLAPVLGVRSASAALRLVRREAIPHVRLGRRVGVRRAALMAWFQARETDGTEQPASPRGGS